MRLIDADELKKELAKNIMICSFNLHCDGLLAEIIDNAPTVDKPYQEGHIDGMLQAEKLYARPIGQWVSNGANTFGFNNPGRHCSLCGKVVEFSENYCPQCGADMRGEKK